MWPFRKKQPIAARTPFELAPVIASAIDAEIDQFGVETLAKLAFAFNPYREIILIRGSLDLPRSRGLIPAGTTIAALEHYPDLLSSLERTISAGSLSAQREMAVDFLALRIASVLIPD